MPRQAQKSGKAGNDLLLNLAESDSSPYPMASGFAIAADINESYSAMSLPEAIADARAKRKRRRNSTLSPLPSTATTCTPFRRSCGWSRRYPAKNENSEGMNGSCHNAYTLRREVALIRAKEEVNGAVGGRQPFGRRG